MADRRAISRYPPGDYLGIVIEARRKHPADALEMRQVRGDRGAQRKLQGPRTIMCSVVRQKNMQRGPGLDGGIDDRHAAARIILPAFGQRPGAYT
jgi:hypothetical protein